MSTTRNTKDSVQTLRGDLERFNWSGDISLSGDQWSRWWARRGRLKTRAEQLGAEGTHEWQEAIARWNEFYQANREM